MHCLDCGKEINDSPTQRCPDCENTHQVTVLSPGEREQFQGVTINQDEEPGREDYQYTSYGPNHRVHVRQIHVHGSSFWSRILIALTIMAFLAALVFVALPIVLVVVAVFAVISFIIRLLR